MFQKVLKSILGGSESKKLYTYPIPELTSSGRRLVIPDVHGCINSLEALVRKIDLQPEDQLFFLGDYINKGPDSRSVLDYLMALVESGAYQIFLLRGNHEDMLLDHNVGRKWLHEFVHEHHSEELLDERGLLPLKYKTFLEDLPYYFEVPGYLLVHAGFNFQIKDPFSDLRSMLYIRDYPVNPDFVQDRRIVHGHNPKPLGAIQDYLSSDSAVIPLDNGCVYYGEREGMGNLLCLNLSTQELIVQENVEF